MPNQAELTLRGVVLAVAITVVFTAANVYLGLKIGLTIATSIPAAVISMAVLHRLRNPSILENNIVQTIASAAGTLSAIIFVLPGLIMLGWWTEFPFWTAFGVCAAGGSLGVMFSIPLRRALVVQSTLPFPEGVAAAEVLKVGAEARAAAESGAGFKVLVASAIGSAAYTALIGTRLFAEDIAAYVRVGPAATGLAGSLSFALLGAGHLVGLWVGLAMSFGVVIAWGACVPVLTTLHPQAGAAAEVARAVWSTQVRFIGAGAIGVAALWKLAELIVPIWRGMRASSARRAATQTLPREERDIPLPIVGASVLGLMIPTAVLFASFADTEVLAGARLPLVIGGLVFTLVVGAFVATVVGYMAGLIGASNSPLSGVGILAIIAAALLLARFALPALGPDAVPALTAFALFVTSVVFAGATIANDNLQDLKTGQLVGATPWRQQVSLVIGVVAGATVIPPVLNLLNRAYGFAGAAHAVASVTQQPLPAPQATLISALARGVLGGNLDWNLIGIGGLIGLGLIALDALLKRFGPATLPPLAVGLGIYLPMTVTTPITLGAVLGWLYDRRAAATRDPAVTRRLGVLLASGWIVGESIFGVLLAGLIVLSGKSAPLALVGGDFTPWDAVLGGVAFAALGAWQYRTALRAGA